MLTAMEVYILNVSHYFISGIVLSRPPSKSGKYCDHRCMSVCLCTGCLTKLLTDLNQMWKSTWSEENWLKFETDLDGFGSSGSNDIFQFFFSKLRDVAFFGILVEV